jgi:hypothetical protein
MRIFKIVFGFILLLFGAGGALVCSVSMMDPVAAQFADDANPLGVPPSLASEVALLLFYLALGVLGGIIIRNGLRK